MKLYNYLGVKLRSLLESGDIQSEWNNESEWYSVAYRRDEETGCYYSVIRIFQKLPNGDKQYPFVTWPNYPNGGTKSVIEMNRDAGYKYNIAINAGVFQSPYGAGVTLTGVPVGTVIQNGVVLKQGSSNSDETWQRTILTMTINNNGELGYAAFDADASQLASNGVVSAVTGFVPIILDFVKAETVDPTIPYISGRNVDTQAQVLGQYGNGDYAIITTAGRGDQGGGFFTAAQLQELCISYGLKFAFLLDGGGSTQTVIKQRQINTVYDNENGRKVPTYIVFKGTTTFDE